ncbi:hypothetical protein K488DRAFT_86632 [Vararia minispora EC-137]|uniref:Uncharacterized protein n=1 Tax=Vararia minispora EC-137 TaxID=1314806 RepID=A0ACB8QIZ4_9AGAM|nr:hypothetical protein K488DRAFT_86632 [Vararia minispora EC-137]
MFFASAIALALAATRAQAAPVDIEERQLFGGLGSFIPSAIGQAASAYPSGLVNGVATNVAGAIPSFAAIPGNIVSGLPAAVTPFAGFPGRIFGREPEPQIFGGFIPSAISQAASAYPTSFVNGVVSSAGALPGSIVAGVPAAASSVAAVPGKIIGGIPSLFPRAIPGVGYAGSVINGVATAVPTIVSGAAGAANTAANGVASAVPTIVSGAVGAIPTNFPF